MSEQSAQVEEMDTQRFLRTNGPPPEILLPSPEAQELARIAEEGKNKAQAFLIKQSSIQTRQNHWIIEQIVGLKGAHRKEHERLDKVDERLADGESRFSRIEATLKIFTDLRAKWLERKALQKKIALALLTMLLLPFLSLFLEDVVKRLLHWQ